MPHEWRKWDRFKELYRPEFDLEESKKRDREEAEMKRKRMNT